MTLINNMRAPGYGGPGSPSSAGKSTRAKYDIPVIDRGKFECFGDQAAGLNPMAANAARFHRTDSDRKSPSKVVTRDILGDPKPGRTPWAAPE